MSFILIFPASAVNKKCAADESLKVVSRPKKSVPKEVLSASKSTGRTLRSSEKIGDSEKKEPEEILQSSQSGESGRRKEKDSGEKLKVCIRFFSFLIIRVNMFYYCILNLIDCFSTT